MKRNSCNSVRLTLVLLVISPAIGVGLTAGAYAENASVEELVAAFSAKVLGSAVFVSGRDLDEAMKNSVTVLAALSGVQPDDYTYVDVNRRKKEVTVSVKDSPRRKARFYGDQGMIILPKDGDDIHFKPVKLKPNLPDAATTDWPMGDRVPEGAVPHNVNPEKLLAAEEAIFHPDTHTAAFVVLYRGQIVLERYGAGAHRDMPLESWSMGKSVGAILYGVLAHQQGRWDPYQPAPIAEWRTLGDPRAKIRVADLLRMSSGLEFTSRGDPPDTWKHAHPDHIYVYSGAINVYEYSANSPAEHPPNTVGRYRNCDPLLIAYAVKQAVEARGENFLEFPRKHLFDKLGIRNMVLETDRWGNFILTGYDYGSARDWARLGLLMAQDGIWQGERILPAGFVDFVSTRAPAWDPPNYGGLFWVNETGGTNLPKSAYNMAGQGGQNVYIVPTHSLVIVRMGHQAGARALGPHLQKALGLVVDAIDMD